MEKQMISASLTDPELKSLVELVGSDSPDVDVRVVADFARKSLPAFVGSFDETFKEDANQCNHTEFKVPYRDDNDFEVPVLVHTPKSLIGNPSNAAIIYAHGGGCVSGDAYMFKTYVSHMAVEAGIVAFNVDFRYAPETKCPKNALDFYCAVKYISENAENLGIDPSRIAIAGDRGGGYICFAVMVMLAQKNESKLVKLAIPGVPLIGDYCFGDTLSMTKEEREKAHYLRKMWFCIADDFEAQRNDPLLFPAKASDEILQMMPPTIIFQNEFDISITEATRMAHRMRDAGRLLEFHVQPGMTHTSNIMTGTKGLEDSIRDYKLAIKEYLL